MNGIHAMICSNALNDNSYTMIKINADITDHSRKCIDTSGNFNSKVFDYQTHPIDGDNDKWNYTIYLDEKYSNTITNLF